MSNLRIGSLFLLFLVIILVPWKEDIEVPANIMQTNFSHALLNSSINLHTAARVYRGQQAWFYPATQKLQPFKVAINTIVFDENGAKLIGFSIYDEQDKTSFASESGTLILKGERKSFLKRFYTYILS